MNSDRLRLYIIEFSLILVLLLALIFNEYITRTIIMTVLLAVSYTHLTLPTT